MYICIHYVTRIVSRIICVCDYNNSNKSSGRNNSKYNRVRHLYYVCYTREWYSIMFGMFQYARGLLLK